MFICRWCAFTVPTPVMVFLFLNCPVLPVLNLTVPILFRLCCLTFTVPLNPLLCAAAYGTSVPKVARSGAVLMMRMLLFNLPVCTSMALPLLFVLFFRGGQFSNVWPGKPCLVKLSFVQFTASFTNTVGNASNAFFSLACNIFSMLLRLAILF